MNKQIQQFRFDSRAELASELAAHIATLLTDAIVVNGIAKMAVSGGSTPKALFQALSEHDIDWKNVTIMLVDERYVAPDDDRSNEKLVREHLLIGRAAQANMKGLWIENTPIGEASDILNQDLKLLNSFDLIILGMGLDGHTASFFPGGSHLGQAMDLSCERYIIEMEAEGAGEPRLTLTLPVINAAKHLFLHIEGAQKLNVLEEALAQRDGDLLPIRVVSDLTEQPLHLYWAP